MLDLGKRAAPAAARCVPAAPRGKHVDYAA